MRPINDQRLDDIGTFSDSVAESTLGALETMPDEQKKEFLAQLFRSVICDAIGLDEFPYARNLGPVQGRAGMTIISPTPNGKAFVGDAIRAIHGAAEVEPETIEPQISAQGDGKPRGLPILGL
jgi:hypothetical protein